MFSAGILIETETKAAGKWMIHASRLENYLVDRKLWVHEVRNKS